MKVLLVICLVLFFTSAKAQPDTTKILYNGSTVLPDSARILLYDYSKYDKWDWNTYRFDKQRDTIRVIIDDDTLFTDENLYRFLIRYELNKQYKTLKRLGEK